MSRVPDMATEKESHTPLFCVVMDCALKERDDGTFELDTIYEIQQLATSAVSNLHVIGERTRNTTYRSVLTSLGLDADFVKKTNASYITGSFFESKMGLREFLDKTILSIYNPIYMSATPQLLFNALQEYLNNQDPDPEVIFTLSDEKCALINSLQDFYQQLSDTKEAPRTDGSIVLKKEATRGEGNLFIPTSSSFLEFLKNLYTALVSEEANKMQLMQTKKPILIEQCRNPNSRPGKTLTYRLAIGIDDKNCVHYKLIFINKHDTLNSQTGSMTRYAFFDDRIYTITEGNYLAIQTISNDANLIAIQKQIEENSIILKQAITKLASTIQQEAIDSQCVKPIDFDFSPFYQTSFSVFFQPKNTHYAYNVVSQTCDLMKNIHTHWLKKNRSEIETLLNGLSLNVGSDFSTQAASSYDNKDKCHQTKTDLTILLKLFLNTLMRCPIKNLDAFEQTLLNNLNRSELYVKVRKLIINDLLSGASKTEKQNKMLQGLTSADLQQFIQSANKHSVSENVLSALREYENTFLVILPQSRSPR